MQLPNVTKAPRTELRASASGYGRELRRLFSRTIERAPCRRLWFAIPPGRFSVLGLASAGWEPGIRLLTRAVLCGQFWKSHIYAAASALSSTVAQRSPCVVLAGTPEAS